MAIYESKVNHNGLSAGTRYEIDDDEIGAWADSLDAGFLEKLPAVVPWVPDPGEPVDTE